MKYIFIGAGSAAKNLFNKLSLLKKKYDLLIVLDNDSKKWGKDFLGTKIDKVENIFHYYDDEVKIVITSSYYMEIIPQLKDLRIAEFITYIELEKVLDKSLLHINYQLKKNKKKDRIFIVGNGPSLQNLNLNLLKDEDTIAVSHIYKSEILMGLNPNYWLVADPTFWNGNFDYLSKIEYTLKNKLKDTCFLINILATYERKFKSLYKQNLVYLYSLNYKQDNLFNGYKINFTGKIPPFAQNVVSVAIMLALFLEYKQIILIGCDHSWWSLTFEEFKRGVSHTHFYKDDKRQININKSIYAEYGYEGLMKTVERQKYEYESLKQNAIENNIKIINATPGGNLECFERRKYNSFFRGEV